MYIIHFENKRAKPPMFALLDDAIIYAQQNCRSCGIWYLDYRRWKPSKRRVKNHCIAIFNPVMGLEYL
jgi:hypothetical protein